MWCLVLGHFHEPSPQLIEAVERLYRDFARESLPTCARRGLCCDFTRQDHILFISLPELIHLRSATPPELLQRGLDVLADEESLTLPFHSRRAYRGVCPFLVEQRCAIHATRPFGCRVFFCDEAFRKQAMAPLTERYLARLRAISEAAGAPWRYGPFLVRKGTF